MDTTEVFISDTAPEAVGPYPHARKIGSWVYLSGVGPRKKGTKKIPGVTFDEDGSVKNYCVETQTKSVIENIETILKGMDLDLTHLVDVQCYLTNMKDDFKTFNRVYGESFNAKTGPTRTTIEVGSLPTPIAVEIKAVAYIK